MTEIDGTIRPRCGCPEARDAFISKPLAAMNRGEAERFIQQRVQSSYLGDHTALTRIFGFHKFFVDTRDVGFGGHVLLDGYWEIWLTLFCFRNVADGMVAIDVGANLGYYTILFANNVGPTGHVIAVEPNPRAAQLLRRSVEINGYSGRTQVEQAACSDGSSPIAQLVIPETEPKNAYVVGDAAPSVPGSIPTACLTLDELCENRHRVDFIKIDAEGAEEAIFAGMSGLLQRHKPIVVIEVNVARYADPASFLRKLRYVYGRLWHVSYDGQAIPVSEDELLKTNVGQDWLLVLCPSTPA